MSQKKFTQELLVASGLTFSRTVAPPLHLHLKLNSTDGDVLPSSEYYRSMVGKLNFLTNTRPDLSFTVQCLSQFMQNPRTPYLAALHHALQYVSSTAGQGILLRSSDLLTLQAFLASDWAACSDIRHSIIGYIILFGNSPVLWKSKKQGTVSRSSSEAEYRAMTDVSSEVTWAVNLLAKLGVHDLKPVTLHCDNQSALHITKNPVFHERTNI